MPAAQRFLGRKPHDRRTGSRSTNERSDHDAAFRDFVPKDFFKSSGLAQHHGTYADQALSHLYEADAGGFGRAVLRHGRH